MGLPTSDREIKEILKSRWFGRLLLFTIGFFFLVVIAIFGTLKFLIYQVENEKYGTFTDIDNLLKQDPSAPTIVYTSDSVELTRFYTENIKNVAFNDLSDELITTLIEIEDPRFYEYDVIDFSALIKTIVSGIFGFRSNNFKMGIAWHLTNHPFLYYKSNGKGGQFIHHIEHYVKAKRLLAYLGKNDLIAFYLNHQEFLFNCRGIWSASKYYFDKEPKDLQWNESAVLVGMLKAPSLYNPKLNPNNALHRRNIVLTVLKSKGHISQNEFDSLKSEPIELFTENPIQDGENNYLKAQIREEMLKWCNTNGKNLYRDGLTVYTTINSRIQNYVIEAAKNHMVYIQQRSNEHWKNREKPWFANEIIDQK